MENIFKKVDDILYISVPKKRFNIEDLLPLYEEYSVKFLCFGLSKRLYKKEDLYEEI